MGAGISLLHFGWPLGFLFAVGLPLLIIAYLRKERRTKIVVSSALLFTGLPKRPRARRRFKPPLQFFIELAALIALVLAVADPFRESPEDHVAVLFDTSMSMNAQQPNTPSNFERGKAVLADWLINQNADVRYTLFSSAPARTQRGPSRMGQNELLGQLTPETISTSTDSLDIDVEFLTRSDLYDRVVVISDRKANTPAASSEQARLIYLPVDARIPNYFIERFELDEQSTTTVFISAGLSAAEPAAAILTISGATQLGAQETKILEQRIDLSPDRPHSLRIPLTESQQSLRLLHATVRPVKNSVDGLPSDNEAWVSADRASSTQLLLVGYPQGSAGLDTLGAGSVTAMSVDQYASASEAEISRYDVLLFYGVTPPRFPSRPTLCILPPEGNALFPVSGLIPRATISSWAAEHPLLRYLNVPLLKPGQAVQFSVPNWGQALIRSEEGAIAIAGTKDGVRRIAVGFELLPFEGRQTLTSSILLLNALQWLSGRSELTTGLRAGSSVRLTNARNWVIRTPGGSLETIIADSQRPEQYLFSQPGVYVVSSAASALGSAITRLYTVQGYSPRESYTWTPPAITLPQLSARPVDTTEERIPLWHWFCLAALGLLILQVLLTHSKRGAVWT